MKLFKTARHIIVSLKSLKNNIMKFRLLHYLFAIIVLVNACKSGTDARYIAEIEGWQDTMNLEFADTASSPLTEGAVTTFKGLSFFQIDPKYNVIAEFDRTPDEQPFGMKTTTDRLPIYVKYGVANFEIDGKKLKLNVYQNQDLILKPGFEDYLFVPFLDLTSGKESYSGGKYLDVRIPENNKLVLDFNKSYNPYCAYNHKYSCPIPPYDNKLDIEIRAGVMKWDGEH